MCSLIQNSPITEWLTCFTSRGLDGASKGSGGGAGGSILIHAGSVHGIGSIDVRGGNGGYSSGGGGSGGIVAIYHKDKTLYMDILLSGGNGAWPGASGFLYEHISFGKRTFSRITVDNRGLATNNELLYTILLCQKNQIDYIIDEINIKGKACLTMRSCSAGRPMSLVTKYVNGDNSGAMAIQQNHDVYMGVTGVDLEELDLPFSIDVKSGGSLSVPRNLIIGERNAMTLTGSLVGVKQLVVSMDGTLSLNYPGHTGYRSSPQGKMSMCSFDKLHVKAHGSLLSKSPGRVKVNAQVVQLDYGSRYDDSSKIPMTAQKKISYNSGTPLNRNNCPHGYEVIALASKTLFNPCGTGKHIYSKSNISYIVQHNISKTMQKVVWKDVDNGNGTLIRVSSLFTWVTYEIKYETRFNVTYYIACDYTDYILLPGQKCTFKGSNYSYRTLEIHNGAVMQIEASKNKDIVGSIKVKSLTIFSGGILQAMVASGMHSQPISTYGGTYGGYGGGDYSIKNLYGSVDYPSDYGSAGGGSLIHRGAGGGVLKIEAQTINLDGTIRANGGPGIYLAGGGSGGSVLISTNKILGKGTIQAIGGKSTSSGGGGGGGRIALHAKQPYAVFRGHYDTRGGSGKTTGSSGTILLRDTSKDKNYDVLLIQGKGTSPTNLPLSYIKNAIDELRLSSGAHFSTGPQTFTIGNLETDGTGKMIVPPNGLLRVNVVNGPRQEVTCDIEVQRQGRMHFKEKVVFKGPSSPTTVISGLLAASEFAIAETKSITVDASGEIRASNITLQSRAALEMRPGSLIRKDSSQRIESLVLHPNARVTFVSADVTLTADYIHLGKNARLTTTSELKFFNVTAMNMIIDSQANVDASGGGLKIGPGTPAVSSFGCGHGGEGGGVNGGQAYGSMFEPKHSGSGNIVRGGGIIHIDVQGSLTLDGFIYANGLSNGNGGSSGGSVLIKANTLKGHGKIETGGGDAGSSSGGGAGGRIALYITHFSPFKGRVSSFGGNGGKFGAPGTVFVREYIIGIPRNTTIVDNNKHITSSKTKIMHGTKSSYFIGKLRLVDGATLEVVSVPYTQMKIKVNELDGDGSGKFHVRFNQTLILSATKAVTPRPFMFPWAMIVDKGATLHLSPKILITRTQTKPSLYLAGRLVGGQEINIVNDAFVVIAKTGMIGTLEAFAGKFFFRKLKVSSGGRIRFETELKHNVPVLIQSVSVDVGFGGTIESPHLLVRTPDLNIAFNGTVHANGLGNSPNQGLGSGSTSGNSGGSYGGCGSPSNCKMYGSLFRATEFGSGGGGIPDPDQTKGSGGGILKFEVDKLVLNGYISSNGGIGKSKLGGGSGGSVNISVSQNFSGRGVVTANGGNGFSSTGSGAGGRVAVLVNCEYKFGGAMFSKGGQSSAISASPGTVYIEEVRPGFLSKRLVIDNRQRSSSVQSYLGHQRVIFYHFNVLTLLGKVTLHLDKDILIDKLISNEDSTIHVQDNVTLEIEPTSAFLKPLCNFQVDGKGEIRLPDTVSFLGNKNVFSGTLTGVLNFIVGVNRETQFLSSARTARFVDGKYTFITKRGEYRFSFLKIKKNGTISFENARLKEIPLTIGTLEINYDAKLLGSWLNMRCSRITVNPGGKIDLSGQGYTSQSGPGSGSRLGSTGTGAGHGGYGAIASGNFGSWYGSALKPNISGSGGGSCSSGVGGSGGGYLHLEVVTSLLINGEINADGTSGDLRCGGGSGGSILISSSEIKGNGLISSSGGSSSNGGGGSGGRIALYVKTPLGFEGSIKTFGGTGISSSAAGTVYINDDIDRFGRKRLWLVNRKFAGNSQTTVLFEPNSPIVYFHELKILGSIRFEIASPKKHQVIIKIDDFIADGAGEIAIKADQTMYAKVLESKETHLTMNTNIHIEEGGNLVAASNVTVDGATVKVDGRLSNVRHLVVESNGRVQFGIKSQTTLMKGSEFVFLSPPGTQQFATVTLKSGSDFGAPQNLSLSAGTVDLKNGVILNGRFIDIKAQNLFIGRGASLSTNDVVAIKRYRGQGISSIKGGSGGGHGSTGGQSYSKEVGGISYGTIYRPYQPGNPGGDGPIPFTGGKGGGVIRVTVDFLWNDGTISSNGGNAGGSDAGGGSGGSVFITVKKSLKGSGMMSADGGLGAGAGGCGAGGRVSVHLSSKYTYIGKLQALGGVSSVVYQSGGPGTVYIQEIRNKLSFNQLHIDNRGQSWDKFVTLQESSLICLFDELHIYRNASLRLCIDQLPRQLKILRLFGDRSGLLHAYQNHSVYVEAKMAVTKPSINMRVDSGGEIILAPKTYIVGDAQVSFELNGTVSGVTDLYVTQSRFVKLNKGSHTSGQEKRLRNFQLSNIKLYSGSAVTMEDECDMNVAVGHLNIKFHASLSAFHFTILASTIDIETGGLLSASGDNKAREAATPQSTSTLPLGAGAGHATPGGRGKGGDGGSFHGSLFHPNAAGGYGGTGKNGIRGGNAGGIINITAGSLVINDGTITVAGGAALTGSSAGGGSGGSLLIKTKLFKGELNILPKCIFCYFIQQNTKNSTP